ncbi:DUF4344 domain-containing metallopeptidase [Roseobacter sp.]|uniref:DUF4344 domain-containing metallopeptidase n=1 Tax=Roseobacter sp. TaxID=1907202 RepID=UPI00385D30EF
MRAFVFGLMASWLLVQSPGAAQTRTDDFVASNVLAIAYHEFGHALIDILQLPVFGQEEDAADVLSVLLIDSLYDEETASAIIYDAAFGFLNESETYEPALWDVHGPDLQRYYTMICLFYGANPDAREDMTLELDLPEERIETCEEEFELANDSWGPVLEDISADGQGNSLVFVEGDGGFIDDLMADEVAELNMDFELPETLTVKIEACDEVNAFYDPNTRDVIICTELDAFLREIADF